MIQPVKMMRDNKRKNRNVIFIKLK